MNERPTREKIPALMDFKTYYRQVFARAEALAVPRFYRGVVKTVDGKRQHIWVSSVPTDAADRRSIACGDESKSFMRAMCDKYNLFGPETGQEILDKMPDDVIAIYEDPRPVSESRDDRA